MTMRERMLATLRGEAHDRVPFVQYSGLSAPDREVWDLVGRENMGILRWSRVCKTERPNCRTETMPFERNGRRGEVNRLITPAGVLEQEKVFDPALGSAATRKHFITEPEHYRVFLAYLRDTIIVDDYETFHNDDRLTGDDGLPLVATERTPFQQLWIRWVSLEDLCVHMIEHADLLNDVLAELARIERALSEAIVRAARVLPVRFVDFPDNITAPAIGPRYFREWCVPFYDELADMLTEFDIPVFVHMDGDLGPLREDIARSGVRGIDSLSPPPDNDNDPALAASVWPGMTLWVNYPSSVHLASPEAVYERAAEILQGAGHTRRLQIQISENVPPGMWRRSYPEIVRAIRDFGTP